MKLNSPALVCEGVSVRFPLVTPAKRWQLLFGSGGDTWHQALQGVSLKVPLGKIVGVIGRNGAGKSTLLRALAGVYPLAEGRVARLGPVSSLFELGATGSLLITGEQYAKRWLRLNGVPRRDWEKIIEEIREFSELNDRLADPIRTYSAGMAARLYFSTATSVGHEIYLIDEILSVGDEHFQAKCWRRIRERLGEGISGVLVTHDWSAILRLCEHTYELEEGRFVANGDSEKVICGYLKIAQQFSTERPARFKKELLSSFHGVSGEKWSFDVPIEIKENIPVFFNFSVEKLILGQDWQILFMGPETLVASSTGEYMVRVEVAHLPLPQGAYRLNLFLSGLKPKDGGIRPGFDIRSWTAGNSLKLSVQGPLTPGLVVLPLLTNSS